MADIRLVRRHDLPMAEARALAERAARGLARYGVTSAWQDGVLRFHRAGIDGHVRLTASQIRVDVKLGLLLRPLKAQLAARIDQQLDRLLKGSPRRSA
jgi:putative polyhydroxyalkanoate system protein